VAKSADLAIIDLERDIAAPGTVLDRTCSLLLAWHNAESIRPALRASMLMKKLQFHLGGVLFIAGLGCAFAPVSFEIFALFLISGFVLLLSSRGPLDLFW
jgi:hypothetical protein